MVESLSASCPYCGESIELLVDASAGSQRYVEDCQVCCRPMVVTVLVDAAGEVEVGVAGEDEA
jgi:hypothetical protein